MSFISNIILIMETYYLYLWGNESFLGDSLSPTQQEAIDGFSLYSIYPLQFWPGGVILDRNEAGCYKICPADGAGVQGESFVRHFAGHFKNNCQ